MKHKPWLSIFDAYNIHEHNFDERPFILTAAQIKKATSHFGTTTEREVRILVRQDTREFRPEIFREMGLFILSIQNGVYALLKGEGYVDIPPISETTQLYVSKLDFELETSLVGNSEMQHLDFAYACSMIRSFLQDDSLVLTIRGRKRTPQVDFFVGNHFLTTKGVQSEVDAGYEGKSQVVLIEAKNAKTKNTLIRQLYLPFRQWQEHTKKKVNVLFFEKRLNEYSFWEFGFKDPTNYNSIELIRNAKFEINKI